MHSSAVNFSQNGYPVVSGYPVFQQAPSIYDAQMQQMYLQQNPSAYPLQPTGDYFQMQQPQEQPLAFNPALAAYGPQAYALPQFTVPQVAAPQSFLPPQSNATANFAPTSVNAAQTDFLAPSNIPSPQAPLEASSSEALPPYEASSSALGAPITGEAPRKSILPKVAGLAALGLGGFYAFTQLNKKKDDAFVATTHVLTKPVEAYLDSLHEDRLPSAQKAKAALIAKVQAHYEEEPDSKPEEYSAEAIFEDVISALEYSKANASSPKTMQMAARLLELLSTESEAENS